MKFKSPGQSNPFALLPFIIFIAIYLGAGLYFQAAGVSMAFYQFPSVTAMFIARPFRLLSQPGSGDV